MFLRFFGIYEQHLRAVVGYQESVRIEEAVPDPRLLPGAVE